MGWGSVKRSVSRSVKKVSLPTINKAIKQTQQNLHRGWDTTRGIAADVEKYGEKFAEDTGKLHRDLIENTLKPENLQQMFNNPLAYGKKGLEPIYGTKDDPGSGFFDKYGGWLNAVPVVGQVAYGIGQAGNIAYDYNNTGNEDLARDQVRAGVANIAAGSAGQGVANYFGPGYTGAVAGGATGGAVAGLGSDRAEEKDVLRNAAVGGLAGGVAHGLSGQSNVPVEVKDANGNVVYRGTETVYDPNTLGFGPVAGQAGATAVNLTNTMDLQNTARRKYESDLNRWRMGLSAYLSNYNQGNINKNTMSAPSLEEKYSGTYAGASLGLGSDSSTEAGKKQRQYGANQYSTSNSQITGTQDLSSIYRG